MACIVHHWDTDGISSAAIVAAVLDKKGAKWYNLTPKIGEFDIPENIDDSELYVVDLNIPEKVEVIAAKFERIFFFDHHLQKRIDLPNVVHVNPNLDGMNYPSASWVVSEHFKHWSHLSALGAIGDIGEKAFEIPEVRRLFGMNEKDALRLVKLIDSSYIVMDKEGVERAVKLLFQKSPAELLEIKEWNKNLEWIEKEIERIISLCECKNRFCEVFFTSNMNVISAVAKRISWELKRDVLAVNQDFNGKAQIYLRKAAGSELDIPKIIQRLKQEGFNSGGKDEVLGVICEKEEVERVLEIVDEIIKN
ncbi:MAG: DHH family phosphoesterase [Archaeoglobus sp.]|nr:DHH family phosphoesterase [Archaeoglobus sp.]